MRFSIIIPTWNNLKYLTLCINSIKKNSTYHHDLNIHLNQASDGSLNFVKSLGIKYSYSEKNIGLCSAVNKASKLANTDYILYSHDDMYFLPGWDVFLEEEINKINTNMYYLSGTTIGPLGCGLNGNKSVNQLNQDEIKNFDFNCGKNIDEFDEEKLLKNYKNGKLHGKIIFYWDNGRIRLSGQYDKMFVLGGARWIAINKYVKYSESIISLLPPKMI